MFLAFAEMGYAAGPETNSFLVHGRVFLDGNANGRLDPGEKGLDTVYVSNGRDFSATDSEGRFTIEVKPEIMPLVYLSQPGGYRTTTPFFAHRASPADAERDVVFGLAPLIIPDAANGGMTFFHISDMHVSNYHGKEGMTKIQRPLVEKLVDELKKDDGLFILNTGDTADGRPEQWAEFAEHIQPAMTCPVWHVVGNHDFYNKKGESQYTNLEHFHRLLGPDYYSFTYLDNHFIVFNDCRNKDSALNLVQDEWLKKDLSLFAAGNKIFFANHVGSLKILSRLKTDGALGNIAIQAIFHGDKHSGRVWKNNGILDIQAPLFNCASGLIDGMDWGYLKITIKGDKVSVEQRFLYDTKNVAPVPPDTDAGEVATGTDWPMFRHDPAHSGATTDRVIPPLKLKWREKLADHFNMSSPIVADGMVIAGLPNEDIDRGGIVALEAATGKTIWKYTTETAVRHTPCCADGKIFFTTSGGETCAVRLDRGERIWTKQGRLSVFSSPAVHNSSLYMAIDTDVQMLDMESGKRLAGSATTEWGYANYISPAVNKDGLVFHGGVGLSLFCFDPGLKTVWHWERKDGKQPFPGSQSSIVAAGDRIFWAANSALIAAEAGTMTNLWTFPLGKGRIIYPTPMSTPAVDQERIYVASEVDGKLYALNQATGEKFWEYQTGESLMDYGNRDSRRPVIFSSPVISGGVIYVGAHDGCLHAVDAKTGQGLGRYDLKTPITSSPAVSGNAIFVTGLNGCLYCLAGGKE